MLLQLMASERASRSTCKTEHEGHEVPPHLQSHWIEESSLHVGLGGDNPHSEHTDRGRGEGFLCTCLTGQEARKERFLPQKSKLQLAKWERPSRKPPRTLPDWGKILRD